MASELIWGWGVQTLPSPPLDTSWAPLETGAGGSLSVTTLATDLKFTGGREWANFYSWGTLFLCELLCICGTP